MRSLWLLVMLLLSTLTLSACEAIKTIFKAGVWTGAIVVVLIVLVVGFVIAKARG